MLKTITVTAAHIAKATAQRRHARETRRVTLFVPSQDCPVALACRDARLRVIVRRLEIEVGLPPVTVALPDVAVINIDRFDHDVPIAPFSFDLDVDGE